MMVNNKTVEDIKIFTKDGKEYAKVLRNKIDKPVKVTLEELTVDKDTDFDIIVSKIEKYGGCIVKNYVSVETVEQILSEATPYLDQDTLWDGTFFPKTYRRVTGMCIKSRTAATEILSHPLNIKLSHKFLGRQLASWVGDEIVKGYSPPQHNSTICFRIGPAGKEGKNQPLHRDDVIHYNVHKHYDKYEYTDSAFGTVLGLSKTTKLNGATRFIPGSHLWDHWRKPDDSEAVYAELEKGDAFFMLASCYHGGSANYTEDEYRTVMVLFMTLGILRQEENIFLGTPIDYFKSLPVETLKMLGLTTSDPFLGYIDFKDPIKLLKPDLDIGKEQTDFYAGQYQGVCVDNIDDEII